MQTLCSPDWVAFLALDFRGDFKAYEIRARQPGATHTARERERERETVQRRGRQRCVKREREGEGGKTCIFAVGNALKYATHFMRHDVNWAQGTMEGVGIRGVPRQGAWARVVLNSQLRCHN